MHTAELDSVEGCTPRSLTQLGDAHSGFKTKFWSQTQQRDAHLGAWLLGSLHTLELDSAVWCTQQSLTPHWDATPQSLNEFENILACLSGFLMGFQFNHENNVGKKSCDTVPLNKFYLGRKLLATAAGMDITHIRSLTLDALRLFHLKWKVKSIEMRHWEAEALSQKTSKHQICLHIIQKTKPKTNIPLLSLMEMPRMSRNKGQIVNKRQK